jgi:site-specific recombinase XerD
MSADKYLNDEQVGKLRACVKARADRARANGTRRGVDDQALIEVFLGTGLRADELCQLQIQDLPYTHGKLIVQVRHGKGDKARLVHIGEDLGAWISQYVRTCRAGAKPEEPLFVGVRGQRLNYQVLVRKVRNLGRLAEVPILTQPKRGCHVLRHTYAFHLYRETHDLRFVQEQLGHASPTTTAVYAHIELDASTKAALNRLAQ